MNDEKKKTVKIRLDQYLAEHEHAASRDDAQRLIRSGKVFVNEECIDKPGTKINENAAVRLTENACPFASRGGIKLQTALQEFTFDVKDMVAADFGASNGGFTDCLLQHGAKKVFAIDVGHGILDYKLQQDKRVVVMDKTNCRHVTQSMLGTAVDLLTADLSFISLRTVFDAIDDVVKDHGNAIMLVKPQFEIGKEKIGKGGLVKNRDDHFDVLCDMIRFIEEKNWTVKGLTYSSITGKSGNIEFLLWIQKTKSRDVLSLEKIVQSVDEAHRCHTIRS